MGNQNYTEKAFETYIEESLIDKGGWINGTNKEWDKKHALFPDRVLSFLKDSQTGLYEKMQKLHGNELDEKIIETLAGFILFHHESIPKINTVITIGYYRFKILKATNTKIELVHLEIMDDLK